MTPSDWNTKTDGGALRCYLDCVDEDDSGYSSKDIVDIEPKFGRLILFKSREVLHEVLPTTRNNRLALTLWLLDHK